MHVFFFLLVLWQHVKRDRKGFGKNHRIKRFSFPVSFACDVCQVIVGPQTDDEDKDGGPWYFSLNNRRLWVFKRLAEEGLLPNHNRIAVRVRQPKSEAERNRYCVQNCALQAKLMREGTPGKSNNSNSNNNKQQQQGRAQETSVSTKTTTRTTTTTDRSAATTKKANTLDNEKVEKTRTMKLESLSLLDTISHDGGDKDESSDDTCVDDVPGRSNRFSVLLG